MKLSQLAGLGLQARIAAMRLGWPNLLTLLLAVVALVGWEWWIPRMKAERESTRAALVKLEAQRRLPPVARPPEQVPLAEQRVSHFYRELGEYQYVEQQVKTLFAQAAKSGLSLSQGEYKSAWDKNGRFHTYQITLPVKGPYTAVKQFSQQTLLAIPFASLDEINFKRDNIANGMAEAKLKLTLFLAPNPNGTGQDGAAGGDGGESQDGQDGGGGDGKDGKERPAKADMDRAAAGKDAGRDSGAAAPTSGGNT